jgi:hypothetical protein
LAGDLAATVTSRGISTSPDAATFAVRGTRGARLAIERLELAEHG